MDDLGRRVRGGRAPSRRRSHRSPSAAAVARGRCACALVDGGGPMTNIAVRAPVGIGTSFVQQLRLLGWSRRWVLLTLTLLFLLSLARLIDTDFGLPRVHVAAMLGLPAAACWALVIWHGEFPNRRSYHLSLPVSRPMHDLARVV